MAASASLLLEGKITLKPSHRKKFSARHPKFLPPTQQKNSHVRLDAQRQRRDTASYRAGGPLKPRVLANAVHLKAQPQEIQHDHHVHTEYYPAKPVLPARQFVHF